MTLTLVKAWNAAKDRLKTVQIDQPAIDARLLLEVAADVTRTDIITDPYRVLTDAQMATLEDFLNRRARASRSATSSAARASGRSCCEVNKNVLTPRPETEVIVDEVLKAFPRAMSFNMLDLGVGSGTILLAVLAERPAAKGWASTFPKRPWPWRARTPPTWTWPAAWPCCAATGPTAWATKASTWWSPTRPTSPPT